jgi:apolipoprotein N-acyltransferase
MKFKVNKYAFFAAALMALAFPPFGLWLLVVPAVSVLVLGFLKSLHKDFSLRKSFANTIFQYTVYVNLLGFYWLSYTLHEFGRLPWLVSVPLMMLIFVAHGVLPSVLMGFLGWVLDKRPDFKLKLKSRSWILVSVFFAVFLIWDLIDFRVFPWTPVQGLGSNREMLASVYYLKTIGWQILVFFLGVWSAVLMNSTTPRTRKWAGFVWLLPAILGIPVGLRAIQVLGEKYSQKQPVVLIQGNIGNNEKRISKLGVWPTIKNVIGVHEKLISQIEAEKPQKELQGQLWTFWPETSYPLYPTNNSSEAEFLFQSSQKTGGPHFVGTYEKAPTQLGGENITLDFNVMAVFDHRTGFWGRYQKRVRVYFGEYVPGDNYWPWIYRKLPQIPHFGAGSEFTGIYHSNPDGPVFVSLICYEVLYRDFVGEFLAKIKDELRAKGENREIILVNPTNDSWYGKTSEPYQHSLLARWNVAEFGYPYVRPTNTGFSQIVAPWGEVLFEGPQDEMALVWGYLPVVKSTL